MSCVPRTSAHLLDILVILVMSPAPALAWWPQDGARISAGPTSPYYCTPRITAGGSGDAIITWAARPAQYDWRIYAQHVDAYGRMLWDSSGVEVGAAGMQVPPDLQEIASDVSGGVIVAWVYTRLDPPGVTDLRAPRLDAAGEPRWGAGGIVLSTVWGAWYPAIAADGVGGAFIVWSQFHDDEHKDRIHAQRVDASGTPQWAVGGVVVCPTPTPLGQTGCRVVSDGAGGAVLAWVQETDPESCVYGVARSG